MWQAGHRVEESMQTRLGMLHNSPDTPHPWATAQLALNRLHTLQRTDAADGLQEAIMVKSVIDNKEALWRSFSGQGKTGPANT